MKAAALLVAWAAMMAPFSPARPESPLDRHERHRATLVDMMRTVNAGDAAGYARLYAADAVIRIFGTGELAGRAAIEHHEVDLLRRYPGTRLAFSNAWHRGDEAVVHYVVNTPAGAGPPTGHEGLLFYRFHPDGLITEERRYLDSLTPMAQAGGLPGVPPRPIPPLPDHMTTHLADGSPLEEANLRVARAAAAALDSGQVRSFLALLAEDAIVDDKTRPRPFSGPDEIGGWMAAWNEEWARAIPAARWDTTYELAVGDAVFAESVVRGAVPAHRAVVAHVIEGELMRLDVFSNGRQRPRR